MSTRSQRPTPTATDWARLAAYIDGEGCINIVLGVTTIKGKQYESYTLRVEIFNTDPRLPIWCTETFGGRTGERKRQQEHWRPCFYWRVNSGMAVDVLNGCAPFFLLKREQYEIAKAFLATIGKRGSPVPQHVLDLRRQFKCDLMAAKWVSRRPSSTRENDLAN